jgi:hypothetical protein
MMGCRGRGGGAANKALHLAVRFAARRQEDGTR